METFEEILETMAKGKWQWQSNPSPWSKTEEPQWESYSLEHNYLIEKAYHEQKKEIDLGDYIISIKHMLQKKKGDVVSQRSIRRINWMDHSEEIGRSQRYVDTEMPKTINKIFGSLGDFVSFFSRRNQGIWDFTNNFKEIEKSNDLHSLNQKIIPKLIECFEETLLKPNSEQLKDSSLSQAKTKILLKVKGKIEELICLFKKGFPSFEEFYGDILRAYTMNTDLYPILNNALRNENWIEVDKLLPYAFCLCKAFFNLRLKNDDAQDNEIRKNKIFLYRGAAFDEFTLSFYNKEKLQYFSWHSVTSTSKSHKMAEEFMFITTDFAKKKYPVMFIIEIPLRTEYDAEYLKWIDIHQYSAIPKEGEVVLAPGSVFELIDVFTDQDQKTIIRIKLKSEIKSLVHRGMMMQGTLQSQMATEKEAKLMCLEGEELSQALMSFCGNKLIEELELCLCTFDKKSLNKMFEGLSTLERAKRLKFVACLYKYDGEIAIEGPKEGEKCEVKQIEIIEDNNFFQMICNEKYNQGYWVSLRELDLDFSSQRTLKDEELKAAASQALKYLTQLTSLKIDCEQCDEITDGGVNDLTSILSSLTQLTHLNLCFQWCQQITERGVINLAQGLKCLTQITDLNLNLTTRNKIRKEGLDGLAIAFNSLTQLTRFNFQFDQWGTINDEEANSLAKLMSSLTQLTYLNIHFNRIDNEAMSILAQGLDPLTKLVDLNVIFGNCDQMTDDGMNNFAKGFISLTQLKHLNLTFSSCKQVTDAGIKSLARALNSLTQLSHLKLNFGDCDQLTDDGVASFEEMLNSLIQLTNLNIKLRSCKQITDTGVESLAKGLHRLVQLTHLDLVFSSCKQIMDAGVESLANRLNSLTQLTHLNLELWSCEEITDAGMKSLAKSLNFLTQLTHLDLNFDCCKQITDEGVNSLSQGLSSLPQLIHLNLNFDSCKQITNDGVSILMSQGLKNLVQLTSLILDFDGCDQIFLPINFLACKWLKHLSSFPSLIVKNKRLQNIDTPPKFKIFGTSRIRLIREDFPEEKQIFSEAVSPLEMTPASFESPFETNPAPESPLEITPTFSESSEQSLQPKPLPKDLMETIVFMFDENEDENADESADKNEDEKADLIHIPSSTSKITETFFEICHLTSLTLDFEEFSDFITDEFVHNLSTQLLGNLHVVRSLALNFKECYQITDDGIAALALHGLKPLTQLKALIVEFYSCSEITDKGVSYLACEGLRHLSQLKILLLDFLSCDKITDEGLISLACYGLGNLPKLERLMLIPNTMSDKGLDGLISQGLQNLPQLTLLSLDVHLSKITGQGVNNLIMQIIKKLPKLEMLDLNLNDCENVSDSTVRNIIKVLNYFGFTKEFYNSNHLVD